MCDEFIKKFLDDPETKEALDWLHSGSPLDHRSLGEIGSLVDSICLVDMFYDAGALEVLAVEIDVYPDGQNTGNLVIKLPKDVKQRAALIEIVSDIIVPRGFDPEEDTGQSYVFLRLD